MKTPLPMPQIRSAIGYDLVGRNLLRVQRMRDERALANHKPDPDSPMNPAPRSLVNVKELMSAHYLKGRYAPGVHKVAWVTSGAPVEVLQALGYVLIYPENHAALCGARKMGAELCQAAEDEGYSKDLCSYVRTDLGSIATGKTPVGRLPPPDLLLCCTNICQTVKYWYEVLAEHFDVPLVVIDTPFLYEDAHDHQVEYVRRQLEEELVPTAEQVAGRLLTDKALHKTTQQAQTASNLWAEILDRSQTRPAPMTAFDGFLLMGPIVAMRGLPETTAYYEKVLAEMDERIAAGVGAIKDERHRVLWDNLPVWYRISRLSKTLAALGVNVVASNYTYAWAELADMFDPADPMVSAARTYLHPILNRSTSHKLAGMRRMIDDFDLDGVILHSDRSCKPYSLGQIDERDRIVEQAGVPAILLEADHNDARVWADEQSAGRIEAFVEMMEAAS
ncbi:MAG: 2-hydroxyacyl-CoA dehydratase family protein [Candidatus Nanopelagicales bacterium]